MSIAQSKVFNNMCL